MTAVYQAGSPGGAGGTGAAAPRLRRAASTIIAMALSRIWPSSGAVASGSQVPAAMSWSRWVRQKVLSRSAMMTSPSRAGVTPTSIQLAACGQVASPWRVNPGPLTVISIPRASLAADEPAPGRWEFQVSLSGGRSCLAQPSREAWKVAQFGGEVAVGQRGRSGFRLAGPGGLTRGGTCPGLGRRGSLGGGPGLAAGRPERMLPGRAGALPRAVSRVAVAVSSAARAPGDRSEEDPRSPGNQGQTGRAAWMAAGSDGCSSGMHTGTCLFGG